MNKTVICFGEVLWDKLPEGPRIGGAPLNVCYHLKQQGIQSSLISQVGDDALGRAILSQMDSWDIDSAFCALSSQYATSVVDVGLDQQGKASYTIVEGVAWDYIPFDPLAAQAVAQADAFVFGSLATRNPETLTTLKRYLQNATYTVMDINLRSPYYQKDIIFDLLNWTNCLKINDEELLLLAQWMGIDMPQEAATIQAIFSQFPSVKSVLLTKGDQGADYYSADQHLAIAAYAIAVKDTVGAGDAFLATFLANQLEGRSTQQSLANASLVSAYVATQAGACPPYTLERLNQFKSTYSHNDDV